MGGVLALGVPAAEPLLTSAMPALAEASNDRGDSGPWLPPACCAAGMPPDRLMGSCAPARLPTAKARPGMLLPPASVPLPASELPALDSTMLPDSEMQPAVLVLAGMPGLRSACGSSSANDGGSCW